VKYIFWGLIGLIVLAVVAVGGGAYWLANMEVDFKSPQMVAKFKDTYTSNCVTNYKQRLEKIKISPSVENETAAESACTCARDPIVESLAKHPKMTISDLATLMATDPEILGITKTCSDKFGIENPS
jgi:hypothetical protein